MDLLIHNTLTPLPTYLLVLVFCVMLYILSKGADMIVDKAVHLSNHFGVPEIIIGATIVSLGTTLPEVTVSVLAAMNGNPDLALGNAIGSIIVDTGLIIGVASFIGRLPINPTVIERQGKIQVFAGILLAFVSLPFLSGGKGNISQGVGWFFLLLLVAYIYLSICWSKHSVIDKTASKLQALSSERGTKGTQKKSSTLLQIVKLCTGIFLLVGSSKILIPAAGITAVRIGIPQNVIAATLIAFGTSLPELVTAITATRKGHGELAIGNIVGADILNVLFVTGSAAAVTAGGLDVPSAFYQLQIPTMLIILVAFRLFSTSKKREITWKEGGLLFLIYIVYFILNYTWL